MAQPFDWNLQRAAAINGMSVEAWIRHCDNVEAAEKRRHIVEREMRSVPTYRDAA